MKKFLTTFVVSLALPLIAFAAYNDVQLTAGSSLLVTVGSNQLEFTVTSGAVQTMQVAAGSITFGLAANSAVDVTSANKMTYTLSKSAGATSSFTCNDANSLLNIAASVGTNETITLTPTGTTCSTVTGPTPGTGGGNEGTPDVIPPPTPTPASTVASPSSSAPAPVLAQATTPAPTPAPAPTSQAQPSAVAMMVSPVFNKDLTVGAKGDDISRLQQLLKTDKDIYPEGQVTGTFGPLTKAAVVKFQLKYKLINSNKDSAAGRIGPKTRAKLKEVFGAPVAAPSAQSQMDQLQALLKQLQDLQNKAKKSY